MTLFIDTTDFHHLNFALVSDDVVSTFTREVAFNENFKTNEYLQQFLKKQKVAIENIKKIVVCSGPGSFTGIRVGVSMAQALGFALNIPVRAITKNKIPHDLRKLESLKATHALTLHYGQKPNITKPKK